MIALIAVGTIALALHIAGKWKESGLALKDWIIEENTLVYIFNSGLLCTLALLLQPELSGVLGMQPLTYAAVMCYFGGHAISRFLGIREAKAEQ